MNKPEGILTRRKRIQKNRKRISRTPGYRAFQQRKVYSKLFELLGIETAYGLTRMIDDYLFSETVNLMSRKWDWDLYMEIASVKQR
jgi:hypothetical protein